MQDLFQLIYGILKFFLYAQHCGKTKYELDVAPVFKELPDCARMPRKKKKSRANRDMQINHEWHISSQTIGSDNVRMKLYLSLHDGVLYIVHKSMLYFYLFVY